MDPKICDNNNVVTTEDEYLILQDLYTKGDDVQKLSVIQALPQLLQFDANATLTRILPKIQQELPKSSCEFHLATSKIFKLLIEKQLPLNLMNAVLQGADSKDPVVANAWVDTLLSVIPILPIDQIKSNVLPLALSKSQSSSPVFCRVASCKILGKISVHTKMEQIDVKTNILPAVQSLCQDCYQDVRAAMCTQLHFVAQGLGDALVKTSLLPSMVELAADDNMNVRSAAVAAVVLVIPYFNKQTKAETIVPLVKKLCQKSTEPRDTTFTTVAKEFGKLLDALQKDLDVNDSLWFLQFYKVLASKGHAPLAPGKDVLDPGLGVECREQCAYNLPAVTFFTVSRISNQLELWHSIFSDLANDSCYIVRKTTAGCIHEIAKILGAQCKLIKSDVVKLLRDDTEDVLLMLVPHLGETLEVLCTNGVLSRETSTQATLEIARALLKCHMELSKGYNWRIRSNFLQQMERLPNCMPSDFIHQHFSPVILNCVLDSRAKPVRSQASRTLLVFLRYNLKEIQRKWIRDNLISSLCYSKSCYTRQIFVHLCVHATEIFSNSYFKKFFFEPLISLTDDPVSNVRLSVVTTLPLLMRMLVMPEDRKLQVTIDNVFSKLEMMEKDKDVKDVLRAKLKEIKSGQMANRAELVMEERRRQEEENKIFQGKSVISGPSVSHAPRNSGGSKGSVHLPRDQGSNRSHPVVTQRSTSAPPRAARTSSLSQGASDMSFLEQHFYIDAGINLPREKIGIGLGEALDIDKVGEEINKLNLLTTNDNTIINDSICASTLSAENIDIDALSERDLKILETSTTNITDDVKVNLRKRNKKGASRIVAPKAHGKEGTSLRCKRYSSVLSTSCMDSSVSRKKTLNRRSLNIGVGDLSKIPCLKKSKSNVEVKKDVKYKENSNPEFNESHLKEKAIKSALDRIKIRPKSAIYVHTIAKDKDSLPCHRASTSKINEIDSSIKNNVPIKLSIKENATKTSALPIRIRRTQSEARK